MSNSTQQIIQSVAKSKGIPAYIMLDTAQVESGMDPNQVTMDTNGYQSVGLFQENLAGVGSGYTVQQLKDPTLNSTLAANAMAPYVQKGAAQGLSGLPLLEYVDNNSGWPGTIGVAGIQAVEPSYDQKLAKVYNGTSGQATGFTGPTLSISGASNVSGITGALQQLHTFENPPSTAIANFLGTHPLKTVHRTIIVGIGLVIILIGIAGFGFSHSRTIPIPIPV